MEQSIIVLAIIIALLLIARHIYVHNLTQCYKCKGTGKVRSSMFSSRYQACVRCKRSGEVRAPFGKK